MFVPMEERVEIGPVETFHFLLFSLAIRDVDSFIKTQDLSSHCL